MAMRGRGWERKEVLVGEIGIGTGGTESKIQRETLLLAITVTVAVARHATELNETWNGGTPETSPALAHLVEQA